MKSNVKTVVVIAGLDTDGRAHAAQFAWPEATSAMKAASLMGFGIGIARGAKDRAAVRSLPKGKLFASGRARVPYLKADAYQRLTAVIELKIPAPFEDEHDPAGGREPGGPLMVGDVVLAFDPKEVGWWEAVVLSIQAESPELSLRWRDFPSLKKFSLPVGDVAILGAARIATESAS